MTLICASPDRQSVTVCCSCAGGRLGAQARSRLLVALRSQGWDLDADLCEECRTDLAAAQHMGRGAVLLL